MSKKSAPSNSNLSNNTHGGARAGAGRPKGSGKYKEPTKAIRVPESSIPEIKKMIAQRTNSPNLAASNSNNIVTGNFKVPLFSSKVAAGMPAPAEDHIDDSIDLNDYLVKHPENTFMLRVEGESMRNIGILPNDILVVDRSLKAAHNKIVIAAVDGELTVKRLFQRGGLVKLLPENDDFPEIELEDESELVIWGVVIGSFRRFQSF